MFWLLVDKMVNLQLVGKLFFFFFQVKPLTSSPYSRLYSFHTGEAAVHQVILGFYAKQLETVRGGVAQNRSADVLLRIFQEGFDISHYRVEVLPLV